MGVVLGPDTEYAKEMRKHEAYPTQYGPPGRPFVYAEFPKMLYKADRVDGKVVITESFKVGNALEQGNMVSRGFYIKQEDALAAIERRDHLEFGTLAAEREHAIQTGKHSAAAVREIRAAESEVSGHLPDVPRTPVRPRRKRTPVGATTE